MLGIEDVLAYSLPLINLLGLLYPNSEGLHEWILYSGGIVLLLAASALVAKKWCRNTLFWVGIFLGSLFLALGSEIPGANLVAGLPLVSMLRVPSRSLFLVGFSLAALAGYGVEILINSPKKDISRKIIFLLIFALGFSILLTVSFFIFQGEIPKAMILGSSGLILGAVWIWIGLNMQKVPVGIWVAGIYLIALIDLGMADLNSFRGKHPDQVFAEGEAVAQFLSSKPGEFRTYSPSYSIPQHTSVRYGIQLADGVDPLQYGKYVQFMKAATGVPVDGYSVTVPPFANADPRTDNASYAPNPDKLGLLNVGYVVSDFELNVQDLELVSEIEGSFIYENVDFMPRAWLSGGGDRTDSFSQVEILESSPNRLILSAEGPGSLTVSEIDYPGWQVEVDGNKVPVLTRQGLLMGVDLTPGQHEIEFSFRPRSVMLGVALFFLGLTGLAVSFKMNKPN
jgi:hypothetical protein